MIKLETKPRFQFDGRAVALYPESLDTYTASKKVFNHERHEKARTFFRVKQCAGRKIQKFYHQFPFFSPTDPHLASCNVGGQTSITTGTVALLFKPYAIPSVKAVIL